MRSPGQPPWRDGEALELAVEAEALRQRAETAAARAEATAPNGTQATVRDLLCTPEPPACSPPDLRAGEPARSANGAEFALHPEFLSGTTGTTSMPRLLALALRARATGRLEFATRPPRALWLEEGRVVGAASAGPGERTEAIALSAGLLTEEQHRATALAAGELGPRSVGTLLVERGLVDASELEGLLRRRAEAVAFTLFSGDAPFQFVNAEPAPPEERIALEQGPLALAIEGARRNWDLAAVDSALGPGPSALGPGAHPTPAGELVLSPEEARALALADGRHSVDEIATEAGVALSALRPILAALVEIGALEVRRGEAGLAPDAPVDEALLAEKDDQVRRADYFTILGLRPDATPSEIGQAADRLLAAFPRVVEAAAPPRDPRLADIRQVLQDARDVLLDDELRSAYLAALAE